MIVSGDYYEVLGVPRGADAKTIKETFRQLARRYHPDISTEPDAEQRFKEIAKAYAVLSDPARRASYDAQGSAGLAGATAEDLWGGIDFTDIFGSGAPAFGNLFERLFGRPQPGSVLRVAGKGLPRYGGHGRGSLNLTVIVNIPRQLSPRQRQLYEHLRAEDAGIRSTAGGSREPDVPRAGRTMAANQGGRHATGRGLLIFASVLLLVIAVANLVGGIAAISGSRDSHHRRPLRIRRLARLGLGHRHLGRRAAAGGCGSLGGQPAGPMAGRGSGRAHRHRPDVLHPRLPVLVHADHHRGRRGTVGAVCPRQPREHPGAA